MLHAVGAHYHGSGGGVRGGGSTGCLQDAVWSGRVCDLLLVRRLTVPVVHGWDGEVGTGAVEPYPGTVVSALRSKSVSRLCSVCEVLREMGRDDCEISLLHSHLPRNFIADVLL